MTTDFGLVDAVLRRAREEGRQPSEILNPTVACHRLIETLKQATPEELSAIRSILGAFPPPPESPNSRPPSFDAPTIPNQCHGEDFGVQTCVSRKPVAAMLICDPVMINPISINTHLPVPVVYDEAHGGGLLTRRLLILMKRALRLLGDEPGTLQIDGAQFFDVDEVEDYSVLDLDELGIKDWVVMPRRDARRGPNAAGNRFCVLAGRGGKVVIGAY